MDIIILLPAELTNSLNIVINLKTLSQVYENLYFTTRYIFLEVDSDGYSVITDYNQLKIEDAISAVKLHNFERIGQEIKQNVIVEHSIDDSEYGFLISEIIPEDYENYIRLVIILNILSFIPQQDHYLSIITDVNYTLSRDTCMVYEPNYDSVISEAIDSFLQNHQERYECEEADSASINQLFTLINQESGDHKTLNLENRIRIEQLSTDPVDSKCFVKFMTDLLSKGWAEINHPYGEAYGIDIIKL